MPMATSNVKILGLMASPFVNRVQFACNLKSIKYELIEENTIQNRELLLQSNPVYKKIPVFFHADTPICESLLILQYIDEIWTNGPSILPSDPYDRARARFWAYYIDEKWLPLFGELKNVQEDQEAKIAMLEKLIEGLVLLEDGFIECSKGKAFFGGDNIGYVDMALGCILGWLRVVEKSSNVKIFDEAKTPRLVGWIERFCSHEAVKDVVQEPDKLLEMLKAFKAMQEEAEAADSK